VMQMGMQRVPPDAAADGEAGEARNWGRDLQPVVKLVLHCVPAPYCSSIRMPAWTEAGSSGAASSSAW
jgi:hypothetical protein